MCVCAAILSQWILIQARTPARFTIMLPQCGGGQCGPKKTLLRDLQQARAARADDAQQRAAHGGQQEHQRQVEVEMWKLQLREVSREVAALTRCGCFPGWWRGRFRRIDVWSERRRKEQSRLLELEEILSGFCDNLPVEQLEAHLRTLSLLHSRLELTSPNVPLRGAIRALHTYVQKQGLQSAETRLKMPFKRLADIGLSVEPLTETAGCFLVAILRQEMVRKVRLEEGLLCNYFERFFDKLDHADPRDVATSLTYRAFAVEVLSVPLLRERFIHCQSRSLAQRWKHHLAIAIDHLHEEDALAWESVPAIPAEQFGSHAAHRAVWTLGNAMDFLCEHLECELPEPQHLHDLIRLCNLVFPIVLELHPDLGSELESLHPHLKRTFGECINNEKWINCLVPAAFSADDNVMHYNTSLLISFLVRDDVSISKTVQTVLQLEQKQQQRQPKGMPSASAVAAAPAAVKSLAAETSGKIRKIVTYNHRVDLHNQAITQGVYEGKGSVMDLVKTYGHARHKGQIAGRVIEQLEATRVNAQAKFQGTSESAQTTYASGKPTDPIDIVHYDGKNKIVGMKQVKISLAEDGGVKSVKNQIKWRETVVGKIKSGKETTLTPDSVKDVKHVILKDHYNDPEVQKLMAENPSMQFEQAESTSSDLNAMIRAGDGDDGTKMSRTKDDPGWEVNHEEVDKLKKPIKVLPSLKEAALKGGIAGASLGFALSLYKAIQLRRAGELATDDALCLVAASTVSGGGSGALTSCLQTWGARLLAQETAGMVALSSAKKLSAWLASNGGTILTLGYLGFDFCRNIRDWWRGEICGRICVKNCLQSSLGSALSMGGGTAIAAVGMALGAAGVGLLVCGMAGAAGNELTAWLLDMFFGTSKEIALANAYRYLGIQPTESSRAVKAAYYKMALQKAPRQGRHERRICKAHCGI